MNCVLSVSDWSFTYLGDAEDCAEEPGDCNKAGAPFGCADSSDWVADRYESIQADEDQDEGGEVEGEHLEELEELAAEVPRPPLDSVGPESFSCYTCNRRPPLRRMCRVICGVVTCLLVSYIQGPGYSPGTWVGLFI